MSSVTPQAPKVVGVEVVAARPTDTDRAVASHLSAVTDRPIGNEVYIVKVRFETMPEPTGTGWALYLGDDRIPKYWAYKDGIYFKVHDPDFLAKHDGQPLRFSTNGSDFVPTGVKLEQTKSVVDAAARASAPLPEQSEVLK
jgi:hypothetical protein